jgi:hypothetical protein
MAQPAASKKRTPASTGDAQAAIRVSTTKIPADAKWVSNFDQSVFAGAASLSAAQFPFPLRCWFFLVGLREIVPDAAAQPGSC